MLFHEGPAADDMATTAVLQGSGGCAAVARVREEEGAGWGGYGLAIAKADRMREGARRGEEEKGAPVLHVEAQRSGATV